jgi:hypothetical protein
MYWHVEGEIKAPSSWNSLQNIADTFQVLRKLGEYRLYKEDGSPVICILWNYNAVGTGETEEAAICMWS